jgi:hypothetical protein
MPAIIILQVDNIADSMSPPPPKEQDDEPPPIPPKSPLIRADLMFGDRPGLTHHPGHMRRASEITEMDPRAKNNVKTIRTHTVNL